MDDLADIIARSLAESYLMGGAVAQRPKANRILAALSAAGYLIVPRGDGDRVERVARALRRQFHAGTIDGRGGGSSDEAWARVIADGDQDEWLAAARAAIEADGAPWLPELPTRVTAYVRALARIASERQRDRLNVLADDPLLAREWVDVEGGLLIGADEIERRLAITFSAEIATPRFSR